MPRDPPRDDHTIWTAVAPDAVFTVRTYATPAAYGHGLVHKSAQQRRQNTRSSDRHPSDNGIVSQVRPRRPHRRQRHHIRLVARRVGRPQPCDEPDDILPTHPRPHQPGLPAKLDNPADRGHEGAPTSIRTHRGRCTSKPPGAAPPARESSNITGRRPAAVSPHLQTSHQIAETC
jgi:hypothetical protein